MNKAILFLSVLVLCNLLRGAVQNEKLKLGLNAENKEKVQLAEQFEKEGKLKKAAKLYHQAADSSAMRIVKAAFYLQEAECWQEACKSAKALESYQHALRLYPLYVPYDKVVPRLRELAQAFLDGNGTFFGLRDRDSAIDIYKLIILETPAAVTSIDDRLRLASIYLEDGRQDEAISTYVELLKQYPDNDDARLDMAQIIMDTARKSDGDGSRLRAAARHAKIIIKRNPGFARREEAEMLIQDAIEQQAQRLLDMSVFYLQKSHFRPQAAKRYLTDLTRDFQGTAAAWEAKRLLDETPELREEK